MKKTLITLTILIFASIVQAQLSSVPPLVNYQGRLTDNNGTGLEGQKTLEFNIYDAASSGNKGTADF